MKSQIAQLKVVRLSSKFIIAASILFQGLQSFCERENSVHQHFVVLRTALQQTYLQAKSGICGFVWGKDVTSCFSSSLTTEIRKFATLFTSNWRFDGYGMLLTTCWLHNNRSGNCIVGTIIVRVRLQIGQCGCSMFQELDQEFGLVLLDPFFPLWAVWDLKLQNSSCCPNPNFAPHRYAKPPLDLVYKYIVQVYMAHYHNYLNEGAL